MRSRPLTSFVLTVFLALFSPAFSGAPQTYAGVQVDEDLTNLEDWNLCFRNRYSEASGIEIGDLFNECDSPNFLFVCRQNNVVTADVIAQVPRADLESYLNGPAQFDNSAVWYYNESQGVGFSDDPTITLMPCDIEGPLLQTKLCWRLDANGEIIIGGRCGASGNLNAGTGTTFIREILFDPCRGLADGTPCNDINLCTVIDTCVDQVCIGTPIPPPVLGDCYQPPVCDRLTGNFSIVPRFQGASCDDGNPCTDGDFCDGQGGCLPGPPLACAPPPGQCFQAGVCNTGTGNCDYAFRPNTSSCNDGLFCTVGDKCDGAGACVGGGPINCISQQECREPGVCNEALNQCEFPVSVDGTVCFLSNLCANSSACDNGFCVPQDTVVCPPPGQCQVSSTCNEFTGECDVVNQPDGIGCDDGDACTLNDECFAGACVGTPLPCPPPPQCYDDNVCVVGVCQLVASAAGTVCTDGNACTEPDECNGAGSCIPGAPVVCQQINQCQQNLACNPMTGCPFVTVADGTPCNDNDVCTLDDECQAGVCKPGEIDFYNPICFDVFTTTGDPGDAAAALPSLFE